MAQVLFRTASNYWSNAVADPAVSQMQLMVCAVLRQRFNAERKD